MQQILRSTPFHAKGQLESQIIVFIWTITFCKLDKYILHAGMQQNLRSTLLQTLAKEVSDLVKYDFFLIFTNTCCNLKQIFVACRNAAKAAQYTFPRQTLAKAQLARDFRGRYMTYLSMRTRIRMNYECGPGG